MEPDDVEAPGEDIAGGCSFGCAFLFVLAGVVWPLLHILGRSYEPEILFIPFIVGAPSFVIAHVLAMISISKQSHGKSLGTRALKSLWIAVGVAIVILIVAIIIEEVTRHSKGIRANKASISTPDPWRVGSLMITQPSTQKSESTLGQV